MPPGPPKGAAGGVCLAVCAAAGGVFASAETAGGAFSACSAVMEGPLFSTAELSVPVDISPDSQGDAAAATPLSKKKSAAVKRSASIRRTSERLFAVRHMIQPLAHQLYDMIVVQ